MKRLYLIVLSLCLLSVVVEAAPISAANLQALTDNVALQVRRMKLTLGTADSAGTVLYAGDSLIARINALSDDEQSADLLRFAKNSFDNIKGLYLRICKGIIQALDAHIAKEASSTLSEYWDDSLSTRIAPEFAWIARDAGINIDADLVWPPAATILQKDSVTASATKITTDSSEIDLTLYGDANLELQVVRISATIESVWVMGKDINGSKFKGLGIVDAGAAIGTTWAVAALIAGQRCYDADSTTLIRGSAGAVYRIQTKNDRTITE